MTGFSVSTLDSKAGVGVDATSVTEDGLTCAAGARASTGIGDGDSLADADIE